MSAVNLYCLHDTNIQQLNNKGLYQKEEYLRTLIKNLHNCKERISLHEVKDAVYKFLAVLAK